MGDSGIVWHRLQAGLLRIDCRPIDTLHSEKRLNCTKTHPHSLPRSVFPSSTRSRPSTYSLALFYSLFHFHSLAYFLLALSLLLILPRLLSLSRSHPPSRSLSLSLFYLFSSPLLLLLSSSCCPLFYSCSLFYSRSLFHWRSLLHSFSLVHSPEAVVRDSARQFTGSRSQPSVERPRCVRGAAHPITTKMRITHSLSRHEKPTVMESVVT